MSLTIRPINAIYNSQNEKVFEFPFYTILDNVIPDLWNDILKYTSYHPFILGNETTSYPCYRKMSEDEFNTTKHKFIEYHHSNRGISIGHDIVFLHYPIACVKIGEHKMVTNDKNYYVYGKYQESKMTLSVNSKKLKQNTELKLQHFNMKYSSIVTIMIFDPYSK